MLVLVSQSAFTALQLSDVQTQVNDTSTQNATYLQNLLNSAVDYCERYLNMDLRLNTWQLQCGQFPIWANYSWGDRWGNYQAVWPFISEFAIGRGLQRWQEIQMPRGPLSSITSIVYYDAGNNFQTLDPSQYAHNSPSFMPARIEPVLYWPISYPRPDAVTITFVTGFTTVPPTILQAIRLLVGTWYAAREAMTYGPDTIATYNDSAVNCLLDQWRPGLYS